MKITKDVSQSSSLCAVTVLGTLLAVHTSDGDSELGSTHHFDFDGFGFAPDEHAHTMIDGLVSRPIVGQNEGEVDKGISTIESVVPV